MKKAANLVLVVVLGGLMASPAFAGSDTTFSVGVTKLMGFLAGSGGLLITIVAIIAAVVAGVTGNIKSALGALGVAILASVGPSVAQSFFNATLPAIQTAHAVVAQLPAAKVAAIGGMM